MNERYVSHLTDGLGRRREGDGKKKKKQRPRKFHYLSKGPRDVSGAIGANGGNLSLLELIKKRKAGEETRKRTTLRREGAQARANDGQFRGD